MNKAEVKNAIAKSDGFVHNGHAPTVAAHGFADQELAALWDIVRRRREGESADDIGRSFGYKNGNPISHTCSVLIRLGVNTGTKGHPYVDPAELTEFRAWKAAQQRGPVGAQTNNISDPDRCPG